MTPSCLCGWRFLYRLLPTPISPWSDHATLTSVKLTLHCGQLISFGHQFVKVQELVRTGQLLLSLKVKG